MTSQTAKISAPGVYDLTMDEYHGDCCVGPSVSSSGLRKIHFECPLEFWSFAPMNPDRYAQPDKAAFTFGAAAHCLLVGGEEFDKHYVVRPREIDGKAWQSNRAACREWTACQIDLGLRVLTEADLTAITLMARVLEKHPMTATLLSGQIEQSILWKDRETGIWVKTRPDVIPEFDSVVVDFKTTASIVQPYKIQREISQRGYFMQMALMEDGMREVLGKEGLNMVLLFQQKSAPFHVAPFEISPEYLEIGRAFNRKALRVMADCLEKDHWPGYVEGIPVAHPPEWLVKEAETTTAGSTT